MKTYKQILTFVCIAIMIPVMGQDEEDKGKRPARPAFESQVVIDNQTIKIPTKNTLVWNIQHRFGSMQNGYSDLIGFYAPSNIKLHFTYSVLDRLNLGVGLTKFGHVLDLSAKYKILTQTRDNSMPISMAYFALAGIDQRNVDFVKSVHRLSYYHQLMIARRLSPKLSLQLSAGYSHFNAVDSLLSNDMIGVGMLGRFKVSGSGSVVFDYTQPVTQHDDLVTAKPNIALGYEIATSSHAFQIFLTNYQKILPQYNLHFSENNWSLEGLFIGFNITRLWNF
ncbi:MAG: hypothetical protein JXQ90_12175 [Cyclobacteriaceae bacterium]